MVIVKKRSKSETGHFKNLMNFEDLLVRFGALGGRYNPARPELQLGSLQQLFQEAQMVMERLNTALSMNDIATNARADLFDTIRPLTTRVVNTLVACGASAKTLKDARGFQRRIQGKRSGAKETGADTVVHEANAGDTATTNLENGETTASKTHSTSQQSYDLRLDHFAKLVSLVQNEPLYQPNEEELQAGTLQAFLQALRNANTNKTYADAELEAVRRERSRIFYDREAGVVTRALQAKAYAKALLGTTSEEYKHIQRIYFRTLR